MTRPGRMGVAGRLALAAAGAVLARAIVHGGGGEARLNYRGRAVSLNGGPALGVAATLTAAAGAPALAAPALVAGLGGTVSGRYDDLAGTGPGGDPAKGFTGHLRALREGRVTPGAVKAVGVCAAALWAAALLPSGRRGATRVADVVVAGGLIAGTANLVNLFDLRPGRALKLGLLLGLPLTVGPAGALAVGPVGAAAALLRADLDERVMLGDSGANAFGALIGLALAARSPTWVRLGLLAGVAALTVAAERVSFTRVIEARPLLRRLDGLGRRP